MSKARGNSKLFGTSTYVVLTDNAERKTSFDIAFYPTGKFYVGKSVFDGDEAGDQTVNAFIGQLNIDIDGNAWRDIECGDYLEAFYVEVVNGTTDAQDFLNTISKELGTSDNAGQVV